jgi:nucleoside-diphosphate-sugar epimerase
MMDWRSIYNDRFARKPVLVTGGAGFIGSHLVDALVSLDADVTVIDDSSGGKWSNLEEISHDVRKIDGSILDQQLMLNVCCGQEFVFHLAALGSVPRSIQEPELYIDVNVVGTANLLEAARQSCVHRVIFSGSSSAYGDPPDSSSKIETMPPLPRSPYAATKLAGEHLMRAWANSYGIDTVVLRYFNIFGPRQNSNSAYAAVIAAFSKAILSGQPATIFGDGSQSRDFTFVANAVHANLLAASCQSRLNGDVLNVAMGGEVDLITLHNRLATEFGKMGATPRFAESRKGDVAHSRADISKSKRVLGYAPLVSFEQGLIATAAWYRTALHIEEQQC